MATIPEKMEEIVTEPTEFNSKKMTKLFNVGYQLGFHGIDWKKNISFHEYDNNK